MHLFLSGVFATEWVRTGDCSCCSTHRAHQRVSHVPCSGYRRPCDEACRFTTQKAWSWIIVSNVFGVAHSSSLKTTFVDFKNKYFQGYLQRTKCSPYPTFQWQSRDVDPVVSSLPNFIYIFKYYIDLVLVQDVHEIFATGC